MPSVVGLLERELGARRRVDELREEVDRVQAELAVAERKWKEWAIACSRVGEVLAPADESGQAAAPAQPLGRTTPTMGLAVPCSPPTTAGQHRREASAGSCGGLVTSADARTRSSGLAGRVHERGAIRVRRGRGGAGRPATPR